MGYVKKLSDDVALIAAAGKLMGGPETCGICKEIEVLDESGFRKIVLDLSAVQWANSMAIGALIKSYLKLRDKGCELCFICLSERLKYYMKITKLIKVIPTYDSLDEALVHTAVRSNHTH